jgi:chromosome segregation ATPase
MEVMLRVPGPPKTAFGTPRASDGTKAFGTPRAGSAQGSFGDTRAAPPATQQTPASMDAVMDPEKSSFGHIDDVCIRLLRQGDNAAALKYLERMRAMIDGICAKMGGAAPGRAESRQSSVASSRPPSSSRLSRAAGSHRPRSSARARSARAAEEGGAARGGEAGSLPVIVAAVPKPPPVDTAAERLAAKDAHIQALKARVGEKELAVAAREEELAQERVAHAAVVTRLKKSEGEAKGLRRTVRYLQGEQAQQIEAIDMLRSEADEQRELGAAAAGVPLEEYEEQRVELMRVVNRVTKLEGHLKQRDAKIRLLNDRLEMTKKDASAKEVAVELNAALEKTQGKLKYREQTAKSTVKILEQREAELKVLRVDVERLTAELSRCQAERDENGAELSSVRKRLDAIGGEYKSFRAMTEKLTAELESSRVVLAERDSLRAQVADASHVVTKMALKSEKQEHKLKASNVELHNSAKAMKALTTELTETKEKLVQKTADSVSMRKQTVAMRKQVEQMQNTIADKDEYISGLLDQTGKRQKRLLDDLQMFRAEAAKVAVLESELASEKKHSSEVQEMLSEMREQFDRQAKEHKETIDFIAERNAWARKVMRLAIEPQLLRQRLAQQTQTMRFLESEVARLETAATMTRMVDTLADEHSAALARELGQTREIVAALSAQNAADAKQLAAQSTTIAKKAKQLSILETEVDKLRRQEEVVADVMALNAQIAEEQLATRHAQDSVASAEVALATLTQQLAVSTAKAGQYHGRIGELETALAATAAKEQAATVELTAMRVEMPVLQAKLVESESSVAAATLQCNVLSEEVEDVKEVRGFLMVEVTQLKAMVMRTEEEVRKREDVIAARDDTIEEAAGELRDQLDTMRTQQDQAVAFEAAERETMRLALTEIILQREATISDLCVTLANTRVQVNTAHTEVARLEGQVASMEKELTEAVVPLVVTEEEQHAVAETMEEIVSLIELLDRVDSRQTILYPSGAATDTTPQPTATPDIVEHDYSRPMANPVVSVRLVRNKRLFSI